MARSHHSSELLREYPQVVREVVTCAPRKAPQLLLKLAVCRIRSGLGPRDFFDFQLHDRPIATWGEYLSDYPHMRRIMEALHPADARALSSDKVLSTERWMQKDIAVAPVIAVAGRDTSIFPSGSMIPVINDEAALVHRLDAADIPDSLFCKPAAGTFGRGVMRADRTGRRWHVQGAMLTTPELAARILGTGEKAGMLVMPTLRNHPDLAPIAADKGLSATRVYTALTTTGVEVFCVLQKVLTKPALADNFGDGAAGHLLCPIDPVSGRFTAAYGRQPGEKFLLRSIERHAATGTKFTDFTMPHWPAILDLAVRATEAMPELPLPGLDIALTPDGPVVLETNGYCYAIAPQLQLGPLRPVFSELIPRLSVDPAKREAAMRALRTGEHPARSAPTAVK